MKEREGGFFFLIKKRGEIWEEGGGGLAKEPSNQNKASVLFRFKSLIVKKHKLYKQTRS